MRNQRPLYLSLWMLALLPAHTVAQQDRDPRNRSAEPLSSSAAELVAALTGEDLSFTTKRRRASTSKAALAAAALIGMGEAVLPELQQGLQADDALLRKNTVYVLARIGIPETLPLRIKAAADADVRVRAYALSGLPGYGHQAARNVLLQALQDPNSDIRDAAIRAFRPSSNEPPGNAIRYSTAKILIPLLDDPATQRTAAIVLGRLDSNVAARPLLKLLAADDKRVRMAAVEALGQLRDQQIAVELTAALRDENIYVRMRTLISLGEISDMRTTPAVVSMLDDQTASLRREAAATLGKIGDLRAVSALLAALEDEEPQVRIAAANSLGVIGDITAVEPLCDRLGQSGAESAAAARALGELRDPRAISALVDALQSAQASSDLSHAAAQALAEIRHPDAVAGLVQAVLETENSNSRLAARRALGQATGRSFSFEPNETIAAWWKLHRHEYLQPLPNRDEPAGATF